MGAPKQPVAGKRLDGAERDRKIVQLALKGWPLRRIGEAVGISHTQVRKVLEKEFARVRPSEDEIESARELQREKLLAREERLNRLIRAHWSGAVSAEPKDLDTSDPVGLAARLSAFYANRNDAAKVVIDADKCLDRVHDRMAKLDGLDAPKKAELTGKDGAPLAGAPSPTEAARLVREAFGEHGAKAQDGGQTPKVSTEPASE